MSIFHWKNISKEQFWFEFDVSIELATDTYWIFRISHRVAHRMVYRQSEFAEET